MYYFSNKKINLSNIMNHGDIKYLIEDFIEKSKIVYEIESILKNFKDKFKKNM